jgi:hypothetical protein
MLDHPLGELLARIIGHVFLEEPTQEIAARVPLGTSR